MARANIFDSQADYMTAAMEKFSKFLGTVSEDVEPFSSHALSDEETDLMYDHPASLPDFDGVVNEQTGMPYSDGEAAAVLLEQMGPVAYVELVEGVEERRARRGSNAT